MRILAVDTSAVTASAAIAEDGKLVACTELRTKMTHSQTILPMITDLLKNSALAPGDMDAVAVNVGPGSFTGVRIGVSAVKGLCFAENIPCIPISTLESIAYNLMGLPLEGVICAVMDARCAQVYTALFTVEGETVERLTPDEAISIENLKNRLISLKKSVFLVGDGASLCYNTLRSEVPSLYLAPDRLLYQNAAGVAAAAGSHLTEMCTADALQPLYLRLPQAERELRARQMQSTAVDCKSSQ